MATKGSSVVKMHNHLALAHFGKLSLNSMRIFMHLLAKLDTQATEFSPVQLDLNEINAHAGGKNFTLAMKAIDELKARMKDIKVLSIEEGKRVYQQMSVIDSIKYIEGDKHITVDFGKAAKPYLLNLTGNYTQAELKDLLMLKSSYAIRFFMLSKSMFRRGEEKMFTIDELKEMFMGSNDAYADYRDFKKWVIEPSQKALANTTVAFNFKQIKKGRTITSISIQRIDTASQHKPLLSMSDEIKNRLAQLGVNITDGKIDQLLTQGEFCEGYINYVIDKKQKDKKVKKLGGAIYSAIMEKQLLDEFNRIVQKKTTVINIGSKAKHDDNEYTYISLEKAQAMFEEERDSGKTKYPFAGFVKGLKTGRKILVEGFQY
jgi:plasmid replication initiation protein